METALYFPYINVPDEGWFNRVLLYWEQTATIVPREVAERSSIISDYMNKLRRAVLLEFVAPDSVLFERNGTFAPGFFAALEARKIKGSDSTELKSTVHVDKMGRQMLAQLEADKLARRLGGPEWESWW